LFDAADPAIIAIMSATRTIERVLPPDSTIGEDLATLDDEDTFEMTNLPSSRTGISGVLFLSTAMASHGPRVKYFVKTGKGQASFSVSIAEPPCVVANSLPERVVNDMAPLVIDWVRLNHESLMYFWNEGPYWTIDELNAFIDQLRKFQGT
jgi:hypothetical protein